MTPAEKMGLKVGDKVRIVCPDFSSSRMGEIGMIMSYDGGSRIMCRGSRGIQWFNINSVQKIPNTTVTGPATITVSEGETIMFEGNATVKQDWAPKFGDRVVFIDPPEDMVGEFGVVTEIENDDIPYKVTYNDGDGSDCFWNKLSEIKPYEAE